MASLTDKTLVPLGAAISSIGACAFWLATLSARVDANQKTFDEYKDYVREAVTIARSIDSRMARLEAKFEYIERKKE